MVELEQLKDEAEGGEIRRMIERHLEYTGSVPARSVLADWDRSVNDFVKVMPTDYKRVVRARAAAAESDPRRARGAGLNAAFIPESAARIAAA